jgi:regulator of replication initiation timing
MEDTAGLTYLLNSLGMTLRLADETTTVLREQLAQVIEANEGLGQKVTELQARLDEIVPPEEKQNSEPWAPFLPEGAGANGHAAEPIPQG